MFCDKLVSSFSLLIMCKAGANPGEALSGVQLWY